MMKQRGFTLMELMVTVAIVGILAAVALPTYRKYIDRSYLGEAFSNLSSFQLQMQQYYQDNGTYAVSNACAISMPASKHFTYVCTLPNSGGFLITGGSLAVDGLTVAQYVYTIDDNNNQTTTAFPGVSGSKACWLTKQGTC